MVKQISRRIAAVLTMVMLLTCFACTLPVNAASKADLKKANVKWDLKNNKTLKYKTTWNTIGVKTHKVKMTKFKVKNAKKKGYKQCTFTLTYNRDINPTQEQKNKMAWFACTQGEYVSPGGEFYFTVVDYNTGKSLEGKNNKKVKVTSSKWKYANKETIAAYDGISFWYQKKATVNVKIVYPKKYKNLAIGVGGYTEAPHTYSYSEGGGAYGGTIVPDAKAYFAGKKTFSQETLLYSKNDKAFAHFMRVK